MYYDNLTFYVDIAVMGFGMAPSCDCGLLLVLFGCKLSSVGQYGDPDQLNASLGTLTQQRQQEVP